MLPGSRFAFFPCILFYRVSVSFPLGFHPFISSKKFTRTTCNATVQPQRDLFFNRYHSGGGSGRKSSEASRQTRYLYKTQYIKKEIKYNAYLHASIYVLCTTTYTK